MNKKKNLQQITPLPILEEKTKFYTHTKIIHVEYSKEFFGNFYMTRSLEIVLEV